MSKARTSNARVHSARVSEARRRRRSSASVYVEAFEPIGSIIADRYKVVAHLGAGQSGAVHLVEDRVMGRKVALKAVHGDTVSQSLDNEVRTLATLSHPNLLEVYDRGAMKDGRVFFTAAYIRGAALADYLAEDAKIPWLILRGVLLGVAHGLDELHAAALVHADVKPDNVLLRPTADGMLVPVIIDFAFARTPGETTASNAGTLAYMAPEVAQGGSPTAAADIYALSIIAYEALTGRNPYEGTSASDTLHRQLNLTRPEATDPLLESGEVLPAEVIALMRRCWSLDPEERPKTAERFISGLLNYLDPLLLEGGTRWCPTCGATGNASDRYCRGCGTTLLDNNCVQCGRTTRDFNHVLCVHCGHWLSTPPVKMVSIQARGWHLPRARAVLALATEGPWKEELRDHILQLLEQHGGRLVLTLGQTMFAVFERTLAGPSACLRATQVGSLAIEHAGTLEIGLRAGLEAAPMVHGCLSGSHGSAHLPDREVLLLLDHLKTTAKGTFYVGKQAARVMGRYIDAAEDASGWGLLRDFMIQSAERRPKHKGVLENWFKERKSKRLGAHACVLIEGEEGSGRTTLGEATAISWQEKYGGALIQLRVPLETPADLNLQLFLSSLVHRLTDREQLESEISEKLHQSGWTDEVNAAAQEMLDSLLTGTPLPPNTRGSMVALCDALCDIADVRIVLVEAPEGVAPERIETIIQALRRRENGAVILVPEVGGRYPTTLCGLAVERLAPARLTGAEMVAWAARALSWVEVTSAHEQALLKITDGHARDAEHVIELLVASGARTQAEVTQALSTLRKGALLDARLKRLGRAERMVLTVLSCLGDWVRSEDISQLAPVQFDEAAFEALLVARLISLEPTDMGVLILVRDRRFIPKLNARVPATQRQRLHNSVLEQLEGDSASRARAQHLAAAGMLLEAASAFEVAADECVEDTPLASLWLLRTALEALEQAKDPGTEVLVKPLWNNIVTKWATLLAEHGRAGWLLGWMDESRRARCTGAVISQIDRLSARGLIELNRVDEAIEMLSQQLLTNGVTDLDTPLDLTWLLIDQGRLREALTVARMGWSDASTRNPMSTTPRERQPNDTMRRLSNNSQHSSSAARLQVEAETLPVNEQASGTARVDTQRHAATAMAKGLLAAREGELEQALDSLLDADDLCRVSGLWERSLRCRMLSAELWARLGNLDKATGCLKNGVSLGLRHGYVVEVERDLRRYLARHGTAPARLRRLHQTLAQLLGEKVVSDVPR